jgi:endonuclease YncB( thermonuclease family)
MYKGTLRVSGSIDLSQFWPRGGSDADTAGIAVTAKSFEFRPNAATPFRRTRVFEGAEMRKKPVISKSGRVTIRVQGIDAPELHFAAMIAQKDLQANGIKFRQLLGETSTDALRPALGRSGNTVDCDVVTTIDKPGDAFDIYGRLVGDLLIGSGAKRMSVAHWLAEAGWAIPAYYNSMLPSEIRSLQQRVAEARKKNRGIWRHLVKTVGAPDLNLVFRGHNASFSAAEKKADVGDVVNPKLFRRRIRYAVLQLNGQGPATFKEYLKTDKTPWTTVKAVLKNPDMKKPKTTLATLFSDGNVFATPPTQLVFFEAPGTLKKNGKAVTKWTYV